MLVLKLILGDDICLDVVALIYGWLIVLKDRTFRIFPIVALASDFNAFETPNLNLIIEGLKITASKAAPFAPQSNDGIVFGSLL